MPTTPRFACQAVVLPLVALLTMPAYAQSVSVARSSIKISNKDTPPSATSVDIRAARNEFEAFQVVVTARSPLKNVVVSAPTLTLDGSSSTIPASEVRVYREQ